MHGRAMQDRLDRGNRYGLLEPAGLCGMQAGPPAKTACGARIFPGE